MQLLLWMCLDCAAPCWSEHGGSFPPLNHFPHFENNLIFTVFRNPMFGRSNTAEDCVKRNKTSVRNTNPQLMKDLIYLLLLICRLVLKCLW